MEVITEGKWRAIPCCILILVFQKILKSRPPCVAKKGANTSDSTAISLIRMLSDGPDVSLSGSPMVSPITAALCGSDPFGPRVLACSEAPAYEPIMKFDISYTINQYILIASPDKKKKKKKEGTPRDIKCLPQCTSWHYPMHHQCWTQR
jgi:hypothetical protein